MGTEYRLACEHCGYTVTTAAHQRKADGRVVTRRYCATCGTVREWEVGVQAAPSGPLGVPLGPRYGRAARLARKLAARLRGDTELVTADCPVCGNQTLLMPQAGQELACPLCGVGRLNDYEAR